MKRDPLTHTCRVGARLRERRKGRCAPQETRLPRRGARGRRRFQRGPGQTDARGGGGRVAGRGGRLTSRHGSGRGEEAPLNFVAGESDPRTSDDLGWRQLIVDDGAETKDRVRLGGPRTVVGRMMHDGTRASVHGVGPAEGVVDGPLHSPPTG